MRFATRLIAIAALGVMAAACSRTMKNVSTGDVNAPAQVKVVNQGYADMDIYVLSNGTRMHLGLVTGNSTSQFTIPKSLVGFSTPLRFLADPVGGRRSPVTEEITVQPGETVELTIPPF